PPLAAGVDLPPTTAPVFTFRSFDRTNAPPLPGFTCWNSTTWNSDPSRSRVMPFLRSFVETLRTTPSQLDHVPARDADHGASVAHDLDHVLDPDAADPLAVDARPARRARPPRQHVVLGGPEPRRFVDLETDAVPEAVDEPRPVAGAVDHRSRGRVDLDPGHPRADRVDRRLLRLPDHVVALAPLGGGV